jgi:hypothetical protein
MKPQAPVRHASPGAFTAVSHSAAIIRRAEHSTLRSLARMDSFSAECDIWGVPGTA